MNPNNNKEIETCTHAFEYSHTERVQASYAGANMKSIDVVICTKCGLIKRNEQ